MKDIKTKVKWLLVKFPELRDDDNKLLATFYSYQVGGWDALKEMTAYDFFMNLVDNKYVNFESIRRVRCRIQEQEPELRGKKYMARKILADVTKVEIAEL
jgi:hypothetical protein